MESMPPSHPPIKALVFDFDGTLAELNIDFGLMRERVLELARRMGYAAPPPQGYLLEQVAAIDQALGNGFSRAAARLIQDVEVEAAGRGRLFPFTLTLLERCRALGLGPAVITRNCGPAVRALLPGADQLCAAFLPREAVARVKPHPGHVLDALARLGQPPEHAAMVGDHPTDMEAARAAGCLAVGVASGRVGQAELKKAGAELTLPHAGSLLEALGF